LAKPNYAFEKRQRELAKKRKQEEKDLRKRNNLAEAATQPTEPAPASEAATDPAPGPRVHRRMPEAGK